MRGHRKPISKPNKSVDKYISKSARYFEIFPLKFIPIVMKLARFLDRNGDNAYLRTGIVFFKCYISSTILLLNFVPPDINFNGPRRDR